MGDGIRPVPLFSSETVVVMIPNPSTPSEKIAQRYAEIFVSVFHRIEGDPSSPFILGSSRPQAGVNGVPFRGSNALLTSLVAADRGFGIPVWLTRSKISELGLLINKGERNTPVVHYDVFYEDVNTKRRDPAMNDALYKALSDEERKNWVKRCYMTSFPEFNIAQTNFSEVYPEQWAELLEEFGSAERVAASCAVIDRMVGLAPGEPGAWLCPVREEEGRKNPAPVYRESHDDIVVSPKAAYADQGRWYSDLVHEMAHSTGSEGRMDRNLSSDLLSDRAQEELVAELAGATVSTMLGVQSGIREHNLGFLKAWADAMGEDPTVIYKAVNEAAKAAELISGTLCLEQRPGFNLERLMDGVEAAREARDKAQERREEYRKSARKGHRKGFRPVKTQPSGTKSKGRRV